MVTKSSELRIVKEEIKKIIRKDGCMKSQDSICYRIAFVASTSSPKPFSRAGKRVKAN